MLVYEQGKGVILDEPAVVALAERDNIVVAVGAEAHAMLGRHPGTIQVIRPMREGVIADYLITEALLRYLITRVMGRVRVVRPEVMVTVPVGVTGVAQVACGSGHTCVTLRNGRVQCWGINLNGQLGDGTTTSRALPTDTLF